jgi:hypothetical protein
MPSNTKLKKSKKNGSSQTRGAESSIRCAAQVKNDWHKPHPKRQRHLHCDCGCLAVKVIVLKVGSDPQYTIHLPLCRECLELELGFLEPGLL